jgi:hypothetical protein
MASSSSNRTGLEPGPYPAVLGDEVHVLQHDDGGGEVARQLRHHGDEVQRAPREHEHGRAGQVLHDVPRGVGLAGAGRPVEQEAALEVLTGGKQCVAAACDLQGVAFDPPEHVRREHYVIAAGPRELGEAHGDAGVPCHELEQLPAVDVVLLAQALQVGVHLLRRCGGQSGDLDAQRRLPVAVRLPQVDDVPAAVVLHEQQRRTQAGPGLARSRRQVDEVRRAQP